jgi:hypothetical protein
MGYEAIVNTNSKSYIEYHWSKDLLIKKLEWLKKLNRINNYTIEKVLLKYKII